ncbi:hypothetical protein CJF30_00007170 [Rutstroemia sp. NJR-2017a BBW]|nr:hypothetical protein CJF30_00007170 [Rutstroemia sp. NJR-2017a BBW]
MRFLDSLGYVLLGWIGHHAAGAHGSASRGGVASESKLCSQIGAELIERGAAHVRLGKCGRCNGWDYSLRWRCSGIGGGGFMLVRGRNGEYETIGRAHSNKP